MPTKKVLVAVACLPLFLSLVLMTPSNAQGGGSIIVSGKATAYNLNLEGDPPEKLYTSTPPLIVAARVGGGAVVAAGTVSTCRDGRWNDSGNPIPYYDVFLDEAFQWMKPGATKVLWYEGYAVYNTIDTPEVRCQQLEDALEAKGYTLTGDATTPITSGLLSGYDILVIPQLQLGDVGTGGDPSLLPDADVQAIVNFVMGGGGLLIMDGSDYAGHNYRKVQNKILKALDAGFYFQDDQVQDDINRWGAASYQPIAVIDTTTAIGSAYQAATGEDEIGLYSICSLRIEKDYDVSVMVSPTVIGGEAGRDLTYEGIITNIGAKADTYTLTVEDELGWSPSISENRISIENGENAKVNIRVTVPTGLTEKVVNWITLRVLGDSGVRDNTRCRAGNFFPLPSPPYPIVHPETPSFLGPGLPTLVVDPPAVPIITTIGSGYGNDLTPREPWPLPYGKGEFAPVGAAALVDDGRVVALFNAILRDRYFDRAELANDEVMSLIARWMINWGDPGGRKLLYFCTEPELGTYHIPGVVVIKWFDVLRGYGFEVETQVGGEITPELLEDCDILHLAELMRSLSPDEIQAVVNWVKAGGGLIIMCQADYAGYGRPRYPNEVLEALNCPIWFQDDEVYDDNSWVVDGPWYPQVYLLDPREANPEFDVWFPEHEFTIRMTVASMTIESTRALFPLTITNLGTKDSSYRIEVWETTAPENLGWEVEVNPTAEVASGENIEIPIFVTVPDIETGRKRMDLRVKVIDGTQTFLTKSIGFAVLGENGRAPPSEAKFKVGQKVSHAGWGEGTVRDVGYAGGGEWAYIVETKDGELKLAAEEDLSAGTPSEISLWIIAAVVVIIVVVVAVVYFVLVKKR